MADAGDEILLEPNSDGYELVFYERDFAPDGLIIASADTQNPAVIHDLKIYHSSGVTLDGVEFAPGVNSAGDYHLVNVTDSSDIAIRNAVVEGGAKDPALTQATMAISFLSALRVEDITLEDTVISGVLHGSTFRETRNLTVIGNEYFNLQGDSIQLGGVENAMVADNYIHDFLGADYDLNHPDAIQIWSTNTTITNRDITLTGNIIDSGTGVATQSIWIRNEKYEITGDAADRYENFTITNNTIHNGHKHGISIANTDGVLIANNLLVEDEDAVILHEDGATEHYAPAINLLAGLTDVTVEHNIAPDFNFGTYAISGDNAITQSAFFQPLDDTDNAVLLLRNIAESPVEDWGVGAQYVNNPFWLDITARAESNAVLPSAQEDVQVSQVLSVSSTSIADAQTPVVSVNFLMPNYDVTITAQEGVPLWGGTNSEHLRGSDGADYIHGGDGNDLIDAGAGADLSIYGGAGADVFAFGLGSEIVRIWDFEPGQDRVQLSEGLAYDELARAEGDFWTAFQTSGGDELILRSEVAALMDADDFV